MTMRRSSSRGAAFRRTEQHAFGPGIGRHLLVPLLSTACFYAIAYFTCWVAFGIKIVESRVPYDFALNLALAYLVFWVSRRVWPFLLLQGHLPDEREEQQFRARLASRRALPPAIQEVLIAAAQSKAPVMDALRMGAALEITSEPGATTFTLTLDSGEA